MNQTLSKISITLAALALLLLSAALLVRTIKKNPNTVPPQTITTTIHDTIIQTTIDTIYISAPIAVENTILRHDTIYLIREVAKTTTDTLALPIEQRVYKNNLYTAWVSGYNPTLDSINIYKQTSTLTVNKESTISTPAASKWSAGIGLSSGIGYVAPFGKQSGIGSFIGISISINRRF